MVMRHRRQHPQSLPPRSVPAVAAPDGVLRQVRFLLVVLLLATASIPARARAIPVQAPGGAPDPLPSWQEGPLKQTLLRFVQRVSQSGSPDWVPVEERLAVFDNDGTLWPENPIPFQLAFVLDALRQRSAREPAVAADPLVKAALAGDLAALKAEGSAGLLHLLELSQGEVSAEAFRTAVLRWLATARHPRYGVPYDQLAYQPMLELLRHLRAHGFRTAIVSGGGTDFMRAWSQSVYGIPPEQVVGSTAATRFELRDGRPVLVKTAGAIVVNDKAAKPVGIARAFGRRPIAAFGNSDGDLAMLQYTTIANPRLSLGLLVHHTDGEREYAYDAAPPSSGRLVEALREAPGRGWLVVDMARDWKVLFPAPRAARP